MNRPSLRRVCIVPRVSGVGGMVTFSHKLAAGLAKHGIEVCYNLTSPGYDAVLVIGGSRQLAALAKVRRRGIPIIQRLDGMNWLHKLTHLELLNPRRARHFLRAEFANLLLSQIRSHLATCVVYQSRFVHDWWEKVYGPTPVPSQVIYNGVDLLTYAPQDADLRPKRSYRLLLVEGSLMGGYESGLGVAVQLAESLQLRLQQDPSPQEIQQVELYVVGQVAERLRMTWDHKSSVHIHWAGIAPQEQIPQIDRTAHLLYSADINAACPNSVIEALACGLPVLAFDTGAIPERVVAYGGDPWRLDPPDISSLVENAWEIIHQQSRFRQAARQRAVQAFALEHMVQQYIQVLSNG
jgi:glycosyltransferase involved in cell wall biosynthesis